MNEETFEPEGFEIRKIMRQCWYDFADNLNIHQIHYALQHGGIDEKRYAEGFEYGWNLAREIVNADTGEETESVMLHVVARDKDVICSSVRRDGFSYDRGAYEGYKQSGTFGGDNMYVPQKNLL